MRNTNSFVTELPRYHSRTDLEEEDKRQVCLGGRSTCAQTTVSATCGRAGATVCGGRGGRPEGWLPRGLRCPDSGRRLLVFTVQIKVY